MFFSFLFRKKIVAFHANVHTIWGYWHIISKNLKKRSKNMGRHLWTFPNGLQLQNSSSYTLILDFKYLLIKKATH